MCGIVGYIGDKQATDVVMQGLTSLEYRGYDSAGIAIYDAGKIAIRRSVGKLNALKQQLQQECPKGRMGIGHTRWATHGKPSESNAHPHQAHGIVVVHNGIIENYVTLKETLIHKGYQFNSDTDSEVLCHLVYDYKKQGYDFKTAVHKTLASVSGAYGVVFMSETDSCLIAARLSSPLIIGLGQNENLVASDIPALLPYTRRVVSLDEGDMVVLTENTASFYDRHMTPVERPTRQIDWSPAMAERGGYKHFMLKEIFEQPQAVADTLRGRIDRERGTLTLEIEAILKDPIQRVVILAMGTSYHAGLIMRDYIERYARIPCQVELASEFRYRDPLVLPGTLAVAISQSGETVDTIAGAKEAKKKGARVLAISNVVDSMITRVADSTLYTRAGIEIGVASTKAYMTQLAAAYLLALAMAQQQKTLSPDELRHHIQQLTQVPALIGQVLQQQSATLAMAKLLINAPSCLFLGRGIQVPTASEGALKLKELSYIHAEGYAAGEMKHGPIALIDEHFFVIMVGLFDESIYDKMISNVEQVKARSGRVLAIVSAQDQRLKALCEAYVSVPDCPIELAPFVGVVPLQFLAYHVACLRGLDVDQPRNLAKSVTVE